MFASGSFLRPPRLVDRERSGVRCPDESSRPGRGRPYGAKPAVRRPVVAEAASASARSADAAASVVSTAARAPRAIARQCISAPRATRSERRHTPEAGQGGAVRSRVQSSPTCCAGASCSTACACVRRLAWTPSRSGCARAWADLARGSLRELVERVLAMRDCSRVRDDPRSCLRLDRLPATRA